MKLTELLRDRILRVPTIRGGWLYYSRAGRAEIDPDPLPGGRLRLTILCDESEDPLTFARWTHEQLEADVAEFLRPEGGTGEFLDLDEFSREPLPEIEQGVVQP